MFSSLNLAFGPNPRIGSVGQHHGPMVCGHAPRSEAESNPLSRVQPDSAGADPLGLKPDPNPSSYPLSRSFEITFIPFLISSDSS
jgi:hypothetical protein